MAQSRPRLSNVICPELHRREKFSQPVIPMDSNVFILLLLLNSNITESQN